MLDTFSSRAGNVSFYIETFKNHLTKHAFVNQPHKHDFYMILLITAGSGTHTIDFQSYDVVPDVAFVMTPGQVHSWNLSSDTDGIFIFFRPEFYQMHLHEDALIDFPFFHSLNANPRIPFKKDKLMDVMLEEMYLEFSKDDKTDPRLLRSYLEILLRKLARNYKVNHQIRMDKAVYKIRKVEQLIEENFKKLKHPSDYADLMHITPSYLNTICKENVGKTLGELIHERIILEAKRLFAYTDLSVKEVTNHLGFTDNSYFVRFFKKHTALTPDQFKESIIRPA